jgi:plastocyanin
MKGQSKRIGKWVVLFGSVGLVVALGLTGCSLYGGGPGGGPVLTSSVDIRSMSFQPANIQVTVGTTVTWTNFDGVNHTVTSDAAVFESGPLADGDTYSYTFNTVGTFPYHCSIHTMMRGSVVVTP